MIFHIKSRHFVLFPPYSFLAASDFLFDVQPALSNLDLGDLHQHVQYYPIIDHFLLSPTPSSHYHVLQKLIHQLMIDKVQHEPCSLALKEFVKLMPEYPPEITYPFTPATITLLNALVPDALTSIASKNPSLIPPNVNLPICEISLLIGTISNEPDFNKVGMHISSLRNLLKNELIISLETSLTRMIETLISKNCCTSAVLSLLYMFIPIIPNKIVFMKLPAIQPVNFSELVPISLQTPSILNLSLLTNINLFKFAFMVVENMAKHPVIESIIPLHRLTLSGSAPIEAALFALTKLTNSVQIFMKSANRDARVTFGSVLACLLTCVEVPELKNFVLSSHHIIVPFFESLCLTAKSLSIVRAFQSVLDLFYLHGTSPLVHVYSCWFKKPQKYQIFSLLKKISPIDVSLSALILELAPDIANFPFLICQLVKKVVFSSSIANIAALQYLANSTQQDDFILFTNSILLHELSYYAIHFVSLFEQEPDLTDDKIQNAYVNIIFAMLFNESQIAARQLEYFSRWIPSLSEASLTSILQRCQKENNIRVFSRFLLMITYNTRFATFMPNKGKLLQYFLNLLQKFLENNDKNVNASLCIAWHNLYISILNSPKSINNQYIKMMFTIGAKTLSKLWDVPELHKLVVRAFCDAIRLNETRAIIVATIGVTQGKCDKFVDQLMIVDEAAAIAKFPGLRNHKIGSTERKAPSKWGAFVWLPYVCGQAMSIKI